METSLPRNIESVGRYSRSADRRKRYSTRSRVSGDGHPVLALVLAALLAHGEAVEDRRVSFLELFYDRSNPPALNTANAASSDTLGGGRSCWQ